MPWIFFALTAILIALGALFAVAIIAPLALSFARKHRINQFMVGLLVVHGALAGAFSPISVYGIFINDYLAKNGLTPTPLSLFLAPLIFNLIFALVVYFVLHRRPGLRAEAGRCPVRRNQESRFRESRNPESRNRELRGQNRHRPLDAKPGSDPDRTDRHGSVRADLQLGCRDRDDHDRHRAHLHQPGSGQGRDDQGVLVGRHPHHRGAHLHFRPPSSRHRRVGFRRDLGDRHSPALPCCSSTCRV